jgi:hypothetical protein
MEEGPLPHPFVQQLDVLVLTNHRFALEGIERLEDEERARIQTQHPPFIDEERRPADTAREA